LSLYKNFRMRFSKFFSSNSENIFQSFFQGKNNLENAL
jgi:hypothetical protein